MQQRRRQQPHAWLPDLAFAGGQESPEDQWARARVVHHSKAGQWSLHQHQQHQHPAALHGCLVHQDTPQLALRAGGSPQGAAPAWGSTVRCSCPGTLPSDCVWIAFGRSKQGQRSWDFVWGACSRNKRGQRSWERLVEDQYFEAGLASSSQPLASSPIRFVGMREMWAGKLQGFGGFLCVPSKVRAGVCGPCYDVRPVW